MDLSRFPSSVQVNAMILQSILREMGLEGSIRISTIEMEYEERPHTRRNNWEEQVAYVCNEINQLTSNTKHDKQLLHYYQLGFLMSQRGFSTAARNRAKTYLLSNRLRDFWEILEELIYYFQGVILQEAADAKIKELINFPSDF
ncbi:hypothetical protein Glove_18g92 [Diversispora epigaea]|uniref:Uncharacterized protein n=1 Tax=Diversispora epigaea TaxID=1348612 RepID=A0A397JXP5_9GLOM|nr:hypothetical protein Glove_18g92 [Diversispora epigaea]